MNSKYLQRFCLIILWIAFAKAADRFVEFTSINNGNDVTAGQEFNIVIKINSNTTESSFDIILRNDNKSVYEKIKTVNKNDYEFIQNKEHVIESVVIDQNKIFNDDDYYLLAYIGDDKVSSQKDIKVIGGTKTTTTKSNTTTSKSTNTPSANETTASITPPQNTQVNNSTNTSENKNDSESIEWNTKNIIIICVLASLLIIIVVLLCYCFLRTSKEFDYSKEVWKLSSNVSSPKLVSSSASNAINATPLWKNKKNRGINNTIQNISAPIINTNFQNNQFQNNQYRNNQYQNNQYQNFQMREQEYESLTRKNLEPERFDYQQNVSNDQQNYRDTIYSNNSGYYTDEMNTQDEIASPTPSYYYQVFKPQQTYRVLYDFQPSLPDEMEIQTGDIIRTEETFEDGWAFGINVKTGKQGTFPMNCLEDDNATDVDSRSYLSERSHSQKGNRRSSSLANSQAIQKMLNDIPKQQHRSSYSAQINKIRL